MHGDHRVGKVGYRGSPKFTVSIVKRNYEITPSPQRSLPQNDRAFSAVACKIYSSGKGICRGSQKLLPASACASDHWAQPALGGGHHASICTLAVPGGFRGQGAGGQEPQSVMVRVEPGGRGCLQQWVPTLQSGLGSPAIAALCLLCLAVSLFQLW